MNKVFLMGRLTRDPEVRYSQGEQALPSQDIQLQQIVDFVVTATARLQILSDVWHLAIRQSLQKNICAKE